MSDSVRARDIELNGGPREAFIDTSSLGITIVCIRSNAPSLTEHGRIGQEHWMLPLQVYLTPAGEVLVQAQHDWAVAGEIAGIDVTLIKVGFLSASFNG